MKICSCCVHFGKCFVDIPAGNLLVYKFLLHSADTCDEYVKGVNEFSKIAKSISVDKIGFNPIHDFMKNKKSNDFRFRFCPLSGVELKQGDERRIWRDNNEGKKV